jgi:hypothetical protein
MYITNIEFREVANYQINYMNKFISYNFSLVQIWLINKNFTSVKEISDVKSNMEYLLHLVSISTDIKNT